MGALHAHVREGARLSASTSELLRIKSRTMANNQDYTEDMAQGDFSNESNYGDFQQTEAQVVQEPAEANGNDSASQDPMGKDEDRKLFVGGLSWATTDKELREHFGKYGEIESITVKMDPQTGRSRGFAFLVFKTA